MNWPLLYMMLAIIIPVATFAAWLTWQYRDIIFDTDIRKNKSPKVKTG